jgi:hypothetical protein
MKTSDRKSTNPIQTELSRALKTENPSLRGGYVVLEPSSGLEADGILNDECRNGRSNRKQGSTPGAIKLTRSGSVGYVPAASNGIGATRSAVSDAPAVLAGRPF